MLSVFAAGSLLVVGIDLVLAVASSPLPRLFGPVPLVIPYRTLLPITGASTALALLSTVLPAAATLRRHE
ncbi:hypothetical protein ACPPVO_52895 [Dactylosporangium sp. McL0621]|uniref:hypothetical protein n=1 Tax=Dactylosporangium sp. McL0621 TaxID=3415678 RepID=UPI003CF91CA2